MLARLIAEPGIDSAEADLHGELLRLQLAGRTHLTAALALVLDLGFAAEPVEASVVGQRAWYGPDRVGELSQQEGRIISARVVPAFAIDQGITTDAAAELERVAAAALHSCFLTHDLGASAPAAALRGACGRAVTAATCNQLGEERARLPGAAVEADLASRGTRPE